MRKTEADEDSKRIGNKIDSPFFEIALVLVRLD